MRFPSIGSLTAGLFLQGTLAGDKYGRGSGDLVRGLKGDFQAFPISKYSIDLHWALTADGLRRCIDFLWEMRE
jgi:hypothetical protein